MSVLSATHFVVDCLTSYSPSFRATKSLMWDYKLGTCESAVCTRIESPIELDVTSQIRIESRIGHNYIYIPPKASSILAKMATTIAENGGDYSCQFASMDEA